MPDVEFEVGQRRRRWTSVRVACKKALDVISKKAKAQRAGPWFKEVKADKEAQEHASERCL